MLADANLELSDLRTLWARGEYERLADFILSLPQVDGLQILGHFVADLGFSGDATWSSIRSFLDLLDLNERAAIAARKAKNAAFAAQLNALMNAKEKDGLRP